MIQVISSNGTQYNTGRIFILDKYGKLKVPSGTSGSGTVTSIATTSPITGGTITTSGTIGITQATTTTDGYLSSTDWNTFDGKFDTPTGTTAEYVRGDGTLATLPTSGGIPKGTAAGTDTYTTTIAGAAYVDGNAYLIRFTNGNTTESTLNINSLGAIPLYRNNDGPIVPGDILDGAEMLCVYNSTTPSFQCIGTSPNTLLNYVTNDDTVTITKGQPVYASGGVGDRLKVKLAYNTGDSTSAQTIGLVFSTSIAAGQQGIIIMQGLLTGLSTLSTSTWTDGAAVYLGATAGSKTPTKPHAPNHLVYLGFVTTASNGNAGRLYVRVQNGYELQELHNVQAQSPSLKDTLYYDNGVSPGQWKTASISTILGYTPSGVYLKNSTTYTATGLTGTQILTSVLIPANTFVAGDVLRVTARLKKTGTNNSGNFALGINSTLSVSGATTFKTNSIVATYPSFGVFAHAVIINATTNTQLPWPATNYGTSDIVFATAVAAGSWQENVAINWTINQYLIFQSTLNSTADALSLIFYMIEKL